MPQDTPAAPTSSPAGLTPRQLLECMFFNVSRDLLLPDRVTIAEQQWTMPQLAEILKDTPLLIVAAPGPDWGYDWRPVIGTVGRFVSITSTMRRVSIAIEMKFDQPLTLSGTTLNGLASVDLVLDHDMKERHLRLPRGPADIIAIPQFT